MIAYLKGKIIFKGEKSCFVLTPGGVGYEVFFSPRAMQHLPDTDQEVEIYIYTVIREDTLTYMVFLPEKRETPLLFYLASPNSALNSVWPC